MTNDPTRLETAQAAYVRAFWVPPPMPFGIDDGKVAAVLEQAVASGAAIPDDYDWWGHLPPGAVA